MPRISRRKKLIFGITLIAVSSMLALVCGEVISRALGLGYGYGPLVGHPTRHHWHETNYEYVCWGPFDQYGGFINHLNEAGLITQKALPAPTEPVYVFLGDSFTEAVQVVEEDRFVSLIEERTGVRCLNLGCSSYSPVLSRILLDEFVDRLSIKCVVLQIYANDFNDDLRYRREGVQENGTVVAVPGAPTSAVVRVARRSHLARLAWTTWLRTNHEGNKEDQATLPSDNDAWSPMFAQPIADVCTPEKLEAITRSVLEIQERCDRIGCSFLVFAVPDRGALRDNVPDHMSDFLRQWCADNKIQFVDIESEFRVDDITELYFPRDIHWTSAGHAAAADVLVERIQTADF